MKAEYVKRGEAFLKDRRFDEASIEFRNALQIDDHLASAHWGLAQAFEGLQRWPEMIAELRKTIELDGNNLDARVKLGNYYMAPLKRTPEMIAEAERLAKEVLQKDPNHIEGHILMATVLFAQGNRDQSLAELKHAIELNPKRIESILSLARYYTNTQDMSKAEETFKQAIAVNGNSAMAHSEYGKFLVQAGRSDQAESEFRRAIEVEPTNRDARFVLASYYLVNKQFDKAEAAYKALADLDKDRPEGRAILADFYSSVGRYDDAVNIYKDVVAKSPDYLRGRYRLSEIMLQRGDVQGASAQVEEVLKANPHDMQALIIRSRIHMQSSDPDGQALSYAWRIGSAPAGSTIAITNPQSARPTLFAQLAGDYRICLARDSISWRTRTFAQAKLNRRVPSLEIWSSSIPIIFPQSSCRRRSTWRRKTPLRL